MTRAIVFGGAFNPPTNAHVSLGEYALRAVGAECVIYVPTKQSYVADIQKKEYVFTDEDRLEMLETLASQREWMIVSDHEIRSLQQPRTYETLCYLKENGYEPTLLFGSDKLPELEHGWRYVEEICKEFGIVCMKRSTDEPEVLIEQDPYLKTLQPYITILETPDSTKGVSSTAVRVALHEMMEGYQNIRASVPEELMNLLMNHMKEETSL
ncbi:MAG: adenylyltransferase/cytidyltransferase family protein [Solobacterium sp.]|nr:adenylyltransferase/cytidyltransferase family protein [Solobacterium sp.]